MTPYRRFLLVLSSDESKRSIDNISRQVVVALREHGTFVNDEELLHSERGGWCAQWPYFDYLDQTGGWYSSYIVSNFDGMSHRIKPLPVFLHFII